MNRLILVGFTLFLSVGLCAQKRPEAVNKLMDALGGQDAWKDASGFYMLEIAHFDNLELPIVREFWIDFETPRIKIESRSNEVKTDRALNVDHGWTVDQDSIIQWNEQTVNGFRSFWLGIPARIFHLIASDDPSLSYKIHADRIEFHVDGSFAVWVACDPEGNPVAYGRSDNHAETHFLGRILDYGSVRLWSEAFEPGGLWRVEMVDFKLLSSEDLLQVSYSTPRNVDLD